MTDAQIRTARTSDRAQVLDLRSPGDIYTGDAVLDTAPFPRGQLAVGDSLPTATAVMRAVSTALAGATYELERPLYHVTRRHDEHGCQRIVIDISEGADV